MGRAAAWRFCGATAAQNQDKHAKTVDTEIPANL